MTANDKYWCAFSRLTKTGSAFVNSLYSYFGSIEHAWSADKTELSQIKTINTRQINDFLEERTHINPEQSIEYIKKRGIDFIHPEDIRYPYLLRFIDNAPAGLFMLGSISECSLNRTLAIAGSRRASESGKTALSKIISEFKGTDICIVSGLAEGIDTAAHKAAVKNGLKTIAVTGSGFDKLYPKSNAKLFNEIIDGNGAVLTEYWMDEDAEPWHFPVRNRIISGLSKGVVIAEAALKSGAMITARCALEQGRELMCIPGLIFNPNTQGIYKLLKSGAAMVTCAKDIIDALNWTASKKSAKADIDNFTGEEKLVLDAVKKELLNFRKLIRRTAALHALTQSLSSLPNIINAGADTYNLIQ